MEFRRINEDEYTTWDALVAGSDVGTVFHSTPWLRATGRRFAIFMAGDPQHPSGGFAVAEQRRMGIRIAAGFPLTPYGGVVLARQEGKPVTARSAHKDLVMAAADYLQVNYDAVAMGHSPAFLDVQPYTWKGYDVRVRYTYVVDVDDLDACWDRMDQSRRRNVRRAEKDGIVVRREDDIEVMLDLVRLTYTRQGKAASFVDYARRLYKGLDRDTAGIFIARRPDGVPVAGSLIVWDDRCAYYLVGGIDHRADTSAAGAYVLWQAMRYCRENRGLSRFDLEGSGIPDIERFFRKFGGEIYPRFDVRWTRPWLRLPMSAISRHPGVVRRLLRS